MNNNLLKHSNSLKSNMYFELVNTENLYEEIPNANENGTYALITMTVTNTQKKFSPIYIMYLLDLKTYLIIDISVSNARFKSDEAKSMINRSELAQDSVIITLNCSPFTTSILADFFKNKKYHHMFYDKNHFTPMINYTKNYFQGMTMMALLNDGMIYDKTIKNFAEMWNTESQPIMKKIGDDKKVRSDVLYFK